MMSPVSGKSVPALPALTVEQHVALPVRLTGRAPDRAHLASVLASVGLSSLHAHLPAELTIGQQQRVAIARALVTKPAVLFADESTRDLGPPDAAGVVGLLRQSVDAGGPTVVMATHDPMAAAYADRVVFLVDGAVVDHIDYPTESALIRRLGRV